MLSNFISQQNFKTKKNLLCRRRKEEIPNRKMKMKTTKKMKRKLYIDYYIIIRIIARESLPYIILFVKHQTFMETDEIVYE